MKEVIVNAEDLVCLTKENLQELIRCKDCIWYVIAELTKDGRRDKRYKPSYCLLMQQYLNENNFCSYGYREKDETN